jgi:hypothetical protein
VDALALQEGKGRNIILDLVLRDAQQLTCSDMAELYSVDVDALATTDLLRAKRELGFNFWK